MNTLLRSATARLVPSPIDVYVPLDRSQELEKRKTGRLSSRRSSSSSSSSRRKISLLPSLTYRRERARHRNVFLKTYKLSFVDSLGKRYPRPRKLVKDMFIKLRRVVVRIVSVPRIGFMRSRRCIMGSDS